MLATPASRGTWGLVLMALSGLVLLFVVAPLAGLILSTPIADLVETAGNEEVRHAIFLSVWTAMAGTAALALPGIALAFLLARRAIPGHRIINAVTYLPIVIPHAAAGVALLTLFARNAPVGGALDRAGISIVGTPAGIAIAMAFVSLPYLISSARDAFENVPTRFERAALNLGATPARTFFSVSLPLAARGIFTGLVLMWARGMSEFGAVIFIAYRPTVTPVLIYEWFGTYGLRYARPVAVLLVLLCLVLFLLSQLISRVRADDSRR